MNIQLNKFGEKSSYWVIFALIAFFGVIYIVKASQYFIPLGNDGVIYLWPVGMFMGQSSLKDFFIALISSFLGEDHLSPVNNLYGYVCYLLTSDPSLVLNITTKLTYLFVVISSLLVVNRLWKDNLRLLIFFLLLTFDLSLTWKSMVHPGISLYNIAPLWCLFFVDRYLKEKRISDIILFPISFIILTFSFESAFIGIPLLVFYSFLFILDTQATNLDKAKEAFKIYSLMFISFLPYLIIHYWLYGTLIPKSRVSLITGGYLINYGKMIALLLNEWSFGVGRFLYGNISLVSIAIIVTVTFPMIAFIVYSIYKYRLLSRTGFYLFVAFIFQSITVLYTGRVEPGFWLLVGVVFCMICTDVILEAINRYFRDKGLYVVRKVVFIIVLTLIPLFVLLNGVVQPFKQAELLYERPYESSQAAYKTINEDADRIIMIRLPDAEDLMHPMAFWLGNKIYNKKAGLWLYPEYYQMLFKNLNIESYSNKNYYPFEYFRQYLLPYAKNKEVILFKDKNLFSRIYLDSNDLKLLRAGVIPYAGQNYFKLYFPDLSAYSKKIEELEFVLTFSGRANDVKKIIYGGKSVENVKINNDKITFYSRDLSLENNLVVNTGSNRTRLSLIEVGIPQDSNKIYNKGGSRIKGGISIKTSNVPCRYEIKSPDDELSIYGTLDAGSMITFNTILERPLSLVYRTFDTNRDKQMVGKIDLSNYAGNVYPVFICPTSLK